MAGPEVWGPHGWKFIHFITLGYPNNPTEQSKRKYFEFFNSLSNVIPCVICKSHFKQNLERFPLSDKVLSNKMEFINWGINIHNSVNQETGKKMSTHKEGFDLIKKNQDKCYQDYNSSNFIENLTDTNKDIYMNPILYLIIGIVILLCYLVYKLYKRQL
jgi:hypothetical protein